MAHSPESWKDVENGLTPETKKDENLSPEVDFKALEYRAFEALEKAHNQKERGIPAREARTELCESLPDHNQRDYVALVESGDSTEILLEGFISTKGDIYARRHPEIDESCKLYQTLINESENSQMVETYLEESVPMDEVVGRDLSFPSEGVVVRLYAPDLDY